MCIPGEPGKQTRKPNCGLPAAKQQSRLVCYEPVGATLIYKSLDQWLPGAGGGPGAAVNRPEGSYWGDDHITW